MTPPSNKVMKIAIGASIALCLLSILLLYLMNSIFPSTKIPKWENIYGPVITMTSAWLIFGIIYAIISIKQSRHNNRVHLTRRKRRDGDP